ncbi:MAG: serine/threonine protein kinase [Myxococcota bacterium]|jgi:serine/threonine protein kinase
MTDQDSSRVGAYRVVRRLGEGAMAVTDFAVHVESGQAVALKRLKVQHLDGWKGLELFQREAKVLASLRHHGIPEVFEFFQLEGDGAAAEFVLAQEVIEGPSLAERIKAGDRLTPSELAQLTLGLLEILDHLHSLAPAILHRDIKPSNILFRKSGAPVLIDFGGVCDGWRPDEGGTKTIVGTTGYMPPEQLMGQASAVSDLYALGATLLHVVSGRPPADFDFSTGRIEVPQNLTMAPATRRLITALLIPAPNARPQTADDARQLFLTDVVAQDVVVEPSKGATSPPHHASPIDLPPTPRDPTECPPDLLKSMVVRAATHARVALNITMAFALLGLFLLTAVSIGDDHNFPVVMSLLLAACIGWPVLVVTLRASALKTVKTGAWRNSKGGRLFASGLQVSARVGLRSKGQNGHSLTYDYEYDGKTLRSTAAVTESMAIDYPEGSALTLLVSTTEPTFHGVLWGEGDQVTCVALAHAKAPTDT